MSTDTPAPEDDKSDNDGTNKIERFLEMPIEDELKNSYLTLSLIHI